MATTPHDGHQVSAPDRVRRLEALVREYGPEIWQGADSDGEGRYERGANNDLLPPDLRR